MGPRGLQPQRARDVARAQTWCALPVFAVTTISSVDEQNARIHSEPRIRTGIPIFGFTDFLALMEQRADKLGIPRAAARARGRVRPRRGATWRIRGEVYIGARRGG